MRDPELSALSNAGRVSREVLEHVEKIVFRVARRAILAVTSATGDDFAEGYQAAPSDPQGQSGARKFQHYGFRSRPPARSEIIALALHGKTSNRVYVASEASGAGPEDQEDGEVEIYSQAGQRIRLRQDGSLLLQVASGAQAQLRADGSVLLVDSSGGLAQLKAGLLTVDSDIARRHDLGTGATPVCVPAPALLALANASTALAAGTDRLFRVTLVVAGANPAVAGTALFIATFASGYASGAMALVALESGDKKFSYSVTNAGVTVTAGETIAPGSTLVFVLSSGGLVP